MAEGEQSGEGEMKREKKRATWRGERETGEVFLQLDIASWTGMSNNSPDPERDSARGVSVETSQKHEGAKRGASEFLTIRFAFALTESWLEMLPAKTICDLTKAKKFNVSC